VVVETDVDVETDCRSARKPSRARLSTTGQHSRQTREIDADNQDPSWDPLSASSERDHTRGETDAAALATETDTSGFKMQARNSRGRSYTGHRRINRCLV
jgi:hypothetical protein